MYTCPLQEEAPGKMPVQIICLLKGAPRRIMVHSAEFLWDLDFRQVGVNGDSGIEPSSKILRGEVVVERDDLLDQRCCAHLVNQGLIVTLTSLHMSDAVRHVQSCQFPDNSRLNLTHEPVLCLQDQVQVLTRQLSSVPPLQVGVHVLKVEVQLVVEVRGNDAVVRQQELVVIAAQQTRHTLGELEVVVAQASKIS